MAKQSIFLATKFPIIVIGIVVVNAFVGFAAHWEKLVPQLIFAEQPALARAISEKKDELTIK